MIEVTGALPDTEPGKKVPLIPLSVSAILHISIMALLVFSPFGKPSSDQTAKDSSPTAPTLSIPAYQMPPKKKASDEKKQPPEKQTPLAPDSKDPDALVPHEAGAANPVDPDLIDPSKRLGEAAPPKVTPKTEVAAATPDVTEPPKPKLIQGPSATTNGSRLTPSANFGKPVPDPEESKAGVTPAAASNSVAASPISAMGKTGFQQTDGQAWQPSFHEAAGRCVEIPDLGRDANGKPNLASVQGRVFWPNHVTPLAGAHLQIVGTPYSTFSDNNGEYLLRFDPTLLEKCRVQYVRVNLAGFESEMLTLSIGAKIRSDDVVLRRR